MTETYERIQLSFLPQTGGGPTPATTVLLDSVLLAASAFALARGQSSRRGGVSAAVGLACLISAAIISSVSADNKRLAINASSGFVITVVAAFALTRLMTTVWMINLALSAMLATGCVFAWKSIAQVAWEYADTKEFWLEQKQKNPSLLESDDPRIINLDRRINSWEASGYLSHSNNAGECLSMWVLSAAGIVAALVVQSRGSPSPSNLPNTLIAITALAGLAVALALTRSNGATVGTFAGLILAAVLTWARRRIPNRSRRVLIVLTSAYASLILAGAAYGVSRGTLPHPSLAFRWHYWTAAARAWLDAPLTGVGRQNFATAYLLHKPAESPEEVRDAHNLWVTLLVEFGPLGLLAVIFIIAVWASRAVRGLMEWNRPDRSEAAPDKMPGTSWPSLAVFTLSCTAIFSRSEYLQSLDPALIKIWSIEIALLWILAFVAVAYVLQTALSTVRGRFCVAVGLAAAVFGALVHNLVGFSLMTPAGSGVFGLLASAALALLWEPVSAPQLLPSPRDESRAATFSRRHPLSAFTVGAIAVAAHLLLVTYPTVNTEQALAGMRHGLANAATPTHAGDAVVIAENAVAFDRWDSETADKVSWTALDVSRSPGIPPDDRLRWQQRAIQDAQIAVRRSPKAMSNWKTLATVESAVAQTLLNADRRDEAIENIRAAARHWSVATTCHPTNSRARKSCAEAWFAVWQQTGDRDAAERSLQEFQNALDLDARYPPEEVMRLNRRELSEIEAHLSQLRRALSTSRPAS